MLPVLFDFGSPRGKLNQGRKRAIRSTMRLDPMARSLPAHPRCADTAIGGGGVDGVPSNGVSVLT
jgi:hypothetical protein